MTSLVFDSIEKLPKPLLYLVLPGFMLLGFVYALMFAIRDEVMG